MSKRNQLWLAAAIVALVVAIFAYASMAEAADQPMPIPRGTVKAQDYPPFHGPYLGIHVGYGQYDASDRSALPGLAPAIYDGRFSGSGWLAGVQAGYDLQLGAAVLGVVADYSWSGMGGSKAFTIPVGPGIGVSIPHEIEEFGTARLRAGVALQNLLLYGTGGMAYAKTSSSVNIGAPINFGVSSDTDRIGFAYGAGAEWKFARNWSLGFEWLHVDFGTRNVSYSTPFGGIAVGVPVSLEADVYKGALNYRF